jgi:nicotinic acid phosphoribosyltransferase
MLNNGKPVATSIPATEHSVMTAWNTEKVRYVRLHEAFVSTYGIYVQDLINSALHVIYTGTSRLELSLPQEAILRMIDKFGTGAFACVMDSYDYSYALEHVLPSIATEKINAGGFMVLRPDSGDPVATVLMALR